ncbi:type IV pilus modification protein PilV [compost metagenome]
MIRYPQRGFTLIEVLMALLVLAVGLLGMASLTMTSLQSNQGAYLRSQASLMAYDIVERMRGNRAEALQATSPYAVTLTSTSTLTNPECNTSTQGCSTTQQAAQDLFDWWSNLQGSIPGATATITRQNTNQFQIVIGWTESDSQQRTTAAQSKSFTVRVDL